MTQRGDFDRPVTAPVPVDRTGADDATRSRALGEWIRTYCTSRPHRDARRAFLAGWDAAVAIAALKPAFATPPAARTGEVSK